MRFFILALAILGVLDSGYLTYTHLFGLMACGEVGTQCNAVLNSEYSKFVGIPLASLGLAMYCAISFTAYLSAANLNRHAKRWVLVLSLIGCAPTPYLIYLQAIVIGHWCKFCVFSTALMILIFIAAFVSIRMERKKTSESWLPVFNLSCIIPNLILLVLVPLLAIGLGKSIEQRDGRNFIESNKFQNAESLEDPIVAQFADRAIKLSEINQTIKNDLLIQDWGKYKLRKDWIENELLKVEANKQNQSIDSYIRELYDKEPPITDEVILKVYNNSPYQKHEITDDHRLRIGNQIATERWKLAKKTRIKHLSEKYNYKLSLLVPDATLHNFKNLRNHPESGPKDARITIVEYSDFECPHCAIAFKELKTNFDEWGIEARIIFRNFPLTNFHEYAFDAAVAGHCAHLQNKFWPYAETLFSNQKQLQRKDLIEHAKANGLDIEEFIRCMKSEVARKFVETDKEEGLELGITTTPAIYINGHFFPRIPTREVLEEILENE